MNHKKIFILAGTIRNADIVRLRGHDYPITVTTHEPNGEPENEVLFLSWDNGQPCGISFNERNLNKAFVGDTKVDMYDSRGVNQRISLFEAKEIRKIWD